MRRLLVFLLSALFAVGCTSSAERVAPTSPARTEPRLPPINARFDYQIGGTYAPTAAAQVLERDRSSVPLPGRYNICYVNAFQTQPGELGWWIRHHPEALLRRAGEVVHDPGWPGEVLLDTSTAAKRAVIAAVVGGWFADCAKRGFDAIEPDNLDSWTRSHRLLTQADNVALATLLATAAHRRGLAIAQKNTPQLGGLGRARIGFDFAVAEECEVYRECASYTRAYGRRVIEIEYTDNGRAAYRRACATRGRAISIILRDREVVPRGRSDYAYTAC